MKIAFYIDSSNYKDIDFSRPDLGNPGIGGTEYMFSLISYYLSKKTKNKIIIFTQNVDSFDKTLTIYKTKDIKDTLTQSNKIGIDFLVTRTPKDKEIYKAFSKCNFKIILWGHNFAKFEELNYIAKCKQVVKYVCVSNEQLKLLNGHSVYKKSTYIYNAIVSGIYKHNNKKKKISICYVGSIIKNKGFHICAKVWRRLYDEGIDVDLNIVGSGKLYNSNAKLGKYGIAKEEYEKEFIKYITDDKGKIIDNVKFYGVLDHKKKTDVMSNSYIGMPNPSGLTETFGISAVEFEVLGVPVVTANACGFKDTVEDKVTGYLCENEQELYERCKTIINMDKIELDKMSKNSIEYSKKFDIEKIIHDWSNLFESLYNNLHSFDDKHENISIIKKALNLIRLIQYKQ